MSSAKRTEAETEFLNIAESVLEHVWDHGLATGEVNEWGGHVGFSSLDEHDLLNRLTDAGLKVVRA